MSETRPYDMGFDCGLNGANTTNCSFWLFSTKERMKEWEHGKRNGEAAKDERVFNQNRTNLGTGQTVHNG